MPSIITWMVVYLFGKCVNSEVFIGFFLSLIVLPKCPKLEVVPVDSEALHPDLQN